MRLTLRSTSAATAATAMAVCGVVATPGVAAAADEPIPAGITVPQVANLADDFMNGVDASSVLSLEESGVTFKDFDGQEADLFEVMAEAGVNYARIRVWNDPYDSEGRGYGGGTVDVARATEIGQRATAAGMKVFVDFHYADFWAHPGQQPVPKAWAGLSAADKAEALYDFTADALQTMEDAGVDVGMVQIGNETTNLQLSGESWPASAALFRAGSQAVRDTVPDAKVAIHFTNPERGNYLGYAEQLAEGPDGTTGTGDEIDYDVFASSYYAYWHGTPANLTTQLSAVAETYGKDVIVAETSWARTLEDGDGYANNIRTAYDQYSSTVQGQALAVRDVIAAVAEVGEAGLGVFYWEPAWLPVGPADEAEQNALLWEEHGSGWATSYAGEYSADAAANHGGSGWDNQAMFDFEGNPLESLRVWDYVRTGTVAPREVDQITAPSLTVDDGDPIELPATVTVGYTDGTSEEVAVTWTFDQSWATGAGQYAISGVTAGGDAVTASLTVLDPTVDSTNYVVNPGFESGVAPWTGTANLSRTDDPYDGTRSAHFYTATGATRTVIQEITGVPAGDYRLSVYAQGRAKVAGESTYITASSGITTVNKEFSLAGYLAWQHPVTDVIHVNAGDPVTVSATLTVTDGAWGTLDGFALVAETPIEEADLAALEDVVDEAAGLDRGEWSAVSMFQVDKSLRRAEFVLGSKQPSQASVDAATAAVRAAIDGLEPGDGSIPEPTVRPVTLTVAEGAEIALPATVTIEAYDETTTTEPVEWNGSLAWIDGPGTYTVTGLTESGRTATATVTVTARVLLRNGGFEKGADDVSPWSIVASPWPGHSSGTFWVNGDGPQHGRYALNLWNGTGAPFDVSATQELTGLEAGTYRLAGSIRGGGSAALSLTATSTVDDAAVGFTFGAWNEWVPASTEVTVGEDGALTVAFEGTTQHDAWGYLDDVTLERVDLPVADLAALTAAVDRAAALERSRYTASSLAALDLAVEAATVVQGAEHPRQSTVDAATDLLEDAIAALELEPVAFDAAPTPTITGHAKAGAVLRARLGTWEPTPTAVTYQWLRDGTPVVGQTGATYLVRGSDRGKDITVAVTAAKAGRVDTTVVSEPVAVPRVMGRPARPTIVGTTAVGSRLSVPVTRWTPAPDTYAYQWLRNGAPISGATDASYTVRKADRGSRIRVTVTVSKEGYLTDRVSSYPRYVRHPS
ncbi:glycosyl hydrolase 53 family protein [Demequina phytophila]|uniref:glycosyl hydrolase 53 family protein n=1 Tax=Demequina phytophila TaxID=1638981 RepID=UPI000781FD08|nr:glycosyl hydrolase 53 family protein [Demequina phytophila]